MPSPAEIPQAEIDKASLNVAFVNGTIVTVVVFALYYYFAQFRRMSVWSQYLVVGIVAFIFNYWVCWSQYPIIHHRYGAASVSHGIYDIVSILVALAAYYGLNVCYNLPHQQNQK